MTTRFYVGVRIAHFLLFFCAAAAWAKCPPVCGLDEVVMKQHKYDLEVLEALPTNVLIVEHEPIVVKYRLAVGSFGVAGQEPGPVNIAVCPRPRYPESTCQNYNGINTGQYRSGEVTTLAPVAGMQSPVTLVVVEEPPSPGGGGEVYAWPEKMEASLKTSVAARYEFALEAFEILHTRSAYEDTISTNLQGMVISDPPHESSKDSKCNLEGFNWCRLGSYYGDADDGIHQLQNIRVGPFLLTPEKEDYLRVLYTVYNLADPGDAFTAKVGEGIANGFSKAGMIVLMGYGAQSGQSTTSVATELDGAMQQLHAAWTAMCDGFTATDVREFPNKTIDQARDKTLDGLTAATGSYQPEWTKDFVGGEYTDGNTVCGPGGRYRVKYALYRTSWRAQ